MIPFDIKLYIKIFKLHIKHKGFGSTTLSYLFIISPILFLNYLFQQFFFLLDELLFFSYRKIGTDRSMFIVGPPRCGTSLFLDLLNKSDDISSMKLWELYFAPSISLKLFWMRIGKIDRSLGSPLKRFYLKLDKKIFGEFHKIHKSSLFHYEEDAMLFYHSGNAPFYLFAFPFEELKPDFVFFDQSTSPAYKAKYMTYYKKCIQKHLFVFGKNKTYLSKNPFFSFYILSLKEHFKDARFIYMARTPFKVVPSAISLATFFKGYTRYVDDEFIKNGILEILKRQYAYPLEVLDFKDQNHNAIIQYQDLISNPKAMVEKILEQFQMNCSDGLKRALSEEVNQHKNYVSKNTYSLEKYNVSEAQIRNYFKEILLTLKFE